jgi:hypothetical protein
MKLKIPTTKKDKDEQILKFFMVMPVQFLFTAQGRGSRPMTTNEDKDARLDENLTSHNKYYVNQDIVAAIFFGFGDELDHRP